MSWLQRKWCEEIHYREHVTVDRDKIPVDGPSCEHHDVQYMGSLSKKHCTRCHRTWAEVFGPEGTRYLGERPTPDGEAA